MTEIIENLSGIIDRYDLFIVDIWGVVHIDGTRTFDGVLPLLKRIKSSEKKVVFLSNAPRRKPEIATTLASIGITPEYYDRIHTSGEETRYSLMELRKEKNFQKCFSLGLSHGLLDDTGIEATEDLNEADFIFGAGFLKNPSGDWERKNLSAYESIVNSALQRNLLWICPNPDIIVRTIAGELFCPGAVAKLYSDLGGHVEYQGKPYPNVYKRIFSWFNGVKKSRALAIGDGINTDILGAFNTGIDSVLVVQSGIHFEEIWNLEKNCIDPEKLKSFTNQRKIAPTFAVPMFQ